MLDSFFQYLFCLLELFFAVVEPGHKQEVVFVGGVGRQQFFQQIVGGRLLPGVPVNAGKRNLVDSPVRVQFDHFAHHSRCVFKTPAVVIQFGQGQAKINGIRVGLDPLTINLFSLRKIFIPEIGATQGQIHIRLFMALLHQTFHERDGAGVIVFC